MNLPGRNAFITSAALKTIGLAAMTFIALYYTGPKKELVNAFANLSSLEKNDAKAPIAEGKESEAFISKSYDCPHWLQLTAYPSYANLGDLDVAGDKITVEAVFNRTAPWKGDDLYQGDLVSKHDRPLDVNYLLRPGCAEITTTDGYYKTPEICPIQLNRTYHVAMVYDGHSLKFYRNGYLMSEVAATGDLVQNDWDAQIGLFYHQVWKENFIGYITEVRIWNIARTEEEIKTYMNQSLPFPQSIKGLLAYYCFNDLKNKQGNPEWDITLAADAFINQVNPDCAPGVDSCGFLQDMPVVPPMITVDSFSVSNPIAKTNSRF
jgi:hypothetical protein